MPAQWYFGRIRVGRFRQPKHATGITRAPTAPITVKATVRVEGSGETAESSDYTLTTASLTFPSGSDATQTATIRVNADDDPKGRRHRLPDASGGYHELSDE